LGQGQVGQAVATATSAVSPEARQVRQLVEGYYDIQKLRLSVYNRIVAFVRGDINRLARALEAKLKRGVDVERLRPSDVADMIIDGRLEVPREVEHLVWLHNELHRMERELAKLLDSWSVAHPIRAHFLDRVRGIGGVLASAIIAYLSPISRFPNISKLWAYCGLKPGARKVRGQKTGYNVRLKKLCFLIATSFEKQPAEKSYYRRIYERKKNYYLNRPDIVEKLEKGVPGVRAHVRMMALRYTVKRFLADLWLEWRKLEGLPITMPYPFAVQGHSTTEYEPWQPDR